MWKRGMKLETWLNPEMLYKEQTYIFPRINIFTLIFSTFLPSKVWPTVMNGRENSIPCFNLLAVIEKSAKIKSAEPFRIRSKNINGELFFQTSETNTKLNNISFIYLSIYIYFACLSVYVYPINAKMAEPIGPKCFVGSHVTKVYGWSNFQNMPPSQLYFWIFWKSINFFL